MTGGRGPVVLFVLCMAILIGIVSFISFIGGAAHEATSREAESTTAPIEECPTFMMRSRDAQLDAAYAAGYHAASDRAQTLRLDNAITDCTRALMECRHPGGAP